MSVASDHNVIHARHMCKHALLRSDCRACVPQFCSHGHTRFECEHCILEEQTKEKKTNAARIRKQKSRAHTSVRRASIPRTQPIAPEFPLIVLPNICCCCGIKHAAHLSCPCRRCHTRHSVDTDCPSAEYVEMFPLLCCGCGIQHSTRLPCPCPRCHSRHPGADCPDLRCTSSSGGDGISMFPIFMSGPLCIGVMTDRVCIKCCVRHSQHSTCPCVRCHRHHSVGDCNVAIGNMDEDLSNCTGRTFDSFCSHCGGEFATGHLCRCVRCHGHHPAADCPASDALMPHSAGCRGCGFRHPSNMHCPCLRCHARHPEADCPAAPRPQRRLAISSQRSRELALSPNVESVAAHNCGAMVVTCPHCRARSWPAERINCCRQGSVHVPNLNEVPAELSALILSPHVRGNFRIYNSLMALASVGHSNKSIVGGTFVLGGSSYHRIGSLVPGATLLQM